MDLNSNSTEQLYFIKVLQKKNVDGIQYTYKILQMIQFYYSLEFELHYYYFFL